MTEEIQTFTRRGSFARRQVEESGVTKRSLKRFINNSIFNTPDSCDKITLHEDDSKYLLKFYYPGMDKPALVTDSHFAYLFKQKDTKYFDAIIDYLSNGKEHMIISKKYYEKFDIEEAPSPFVS